MFGRYRLEEQLGAGGVGEVWRAVDTSLERVVALKMLLPRFRDDPESAARFHREARLAARLRHPHIVRVHAFGELDRRLYLDMELVEGESLAAALVAGGPLAPARAADVVERIADALDTAHAVDGPPEQRMVHRDVKPANILLEPRPRGREHVYLVDFGVARTVAAGPAITGVGSVVGTPAYMAPELWEGHGSDHRVDVYALAVTAFEILTGRLPYPRSTIEGLVTAHLTEPVPRPSELRRDLPAAVDAVIARGMAKDPDARHAGAGEFAAALAQALVRAPEPDTRPGPVPAGAATTGVAGPRPGAVAPSAPPTVDTGVLWPGGSAPATPPGRAHPPRTQAPSRTAVPTPGPPGAAPPAGGASAPGGASPVGSARPAGSSRPGSSPSAQAGAPSDGSPSPGPRGSSSQPGPSAMPGVRPQPSGAHDGRPPAPDRRASTSYLGSPPHFAGLATTALLVPLYLAGLVPVTWIMLAAFALLYVLGAVLTAVLRPRRP